MHRLESRPGRPLDVRLRGFLRLEAAAADRVVVAIGDLSCPSRAGLLDEHDSAGDSVVIGVSVGAHFRFPFLRVFPLLLVPLYRVVDGIIYTISSPYSQRICAWAMDSDFFVVKTLPWKCFRLPVAARSVFCSSSDIGIRCPLVSPPVSPLVVSCYRSHGLPACSTRTAGRFEVQMSKLSVVNLIPHVEGTR